MLSINKIFVIASFLFLLVIKVSGQDSCNALGQVPSTAFPVCGGSTFFQANVPQCGGFSVPVPSRVCRAQIYSDINPFWYKFTCFKTGKLGFLIKPISNSDDYDWQLFDITNRDPADVYVDTTMFVACNWSGDTLSTGTSDTATLENGCAGYSQFNPGNYNISMEPTIYKGHEYLLLVSNFSPSQQGYGLTFYGGGSGSAVITDTLTPKVSSTSINCAGDKIGIKLNKRMLCNSLASNASDFQISTNPLIQSIVGKGCLTGFDMDSITITLQNPLPIGRYKLITKIGTDTSTLKDICGTQVAINDTFQFDVVPQFPTLMDSITTPTSCSPQQLELVFKTPLRCFTVADDGSQFVVTGPAPSKTVIPIFGAATDCDTLGLTYKVYINLANSLTVDGIYTITLKDSVNLTPLINDCSVPTPKGSFLNFFARNVVSPQFNFQIKSGCKQDTVLLNYLGFNPLANNTSSWKWYLHDSLISIGKDTSYFKTVFTDDTIKLVVSNGLCSDSLIQIIQPLDHSIKANFSFQDSICPISQSYFKDSSLGVNVAWEWNFNNGSGVILGQNPPLQTYPLGLKDSVCNSQLIVTNQVGCKDTIVKPIKVRNAIPSYPDSVITVKCAPDSIELVFTKPIICNSILANGSNFNLYNALGNSIPVVGASAVNCVNGISKMVRIQLGATLRNNGNYRLAVQHVGLDSIRSECNIPTPDTAVRFKVIYNVTAAIDTVIRINCKADTLFVNNIGNDGINKWLWTLGTSAKDSIQKTKFIYSNFNPTTLQLIVSNGVCKDTNQVNIVPLDHTVKAGYNLADSICPRTLVNFTDTSKGIIRNWNWSFGNGKTSSLPSPLAQVYPSILKDSLYKTQLIVTNQLGCKDTTKRTLFVKNALPAYPDSIVTVKCAPDSIELVFKKPIQCNTILVNGSNFKLYNSLGNTIPVISASAVKCVNGLSKIVRIQLGTTLRTNGNYRLTVQHVGIDSIRTECGNPTPDTAVRFKVKYNVTASIDTIIKIGCKADTLLVNNLGKDSINKWLWTLGTSAKDSIQKTKFIYSNFNPTTLQLIVSNGVCKDTNQVNIVPLDHTVKAGYILADSICPRTLVNFTDTSKGIIRNWNWSFGNGKTSSLPSPLVQVYPSILKDSLYKTQLIVTNQIGCKDTAKRTLFVKNALPAYPDSIVTVKCAPDSIELVFKKPIQCNSILINGGNFKLYNSLGNTIPIVGASGVKCVNGLSKIVRIKLGNTLRTNGNYRLTVQHVGIDSIRTECGNPTPDTAVRFKVKYNVTASIDTIIKIGCKADTLLVNNLGKDSINKWFWTLGTAAKDSIQKTKFIYSNFNPTTLQLIVSNGVCKDTNRLNIVPLDHTVKASFTSVDSICANIPVSFINKSLGNLTQWKWNFGNGTIVNIKTPLPQNYPSIPQYKTYPIQLIVKNNLGCFDTASSKLTIIPSTISKLDSIPKLPCAPQRIGIKMKLPIQCNSVASNGSNFSITGPSIVKISNATILCNGKIGDSIILTLSSPITVPGKYTLYIKQSPSGGFILNQCGAPTTADSLKFNALNAVKANFTPIIKTGCNIDTLSLNHDGKNNVIKWNWIIDSQLISKAKDTNIIYKNLSPKKVQLIVANAVCSDTSLYFPIVFKNVNDTVKADFLIKKQYQQSLELADFICPKEKVLVQDTSVGIINKWSWDFGNGQKSIAQYPPIQSYSRKNSIINYPIRLIIKGNYCIDTAIKYLKVIPNCYIDVPSAFTPNGDNINDYLYPLNAYKADNLEFKVYNRYGQIVFKTNDWTQKWDGTVNGKVQISGTYIWMLDYTDHDSGERVSLKGTSVLIR